MKEIKVKYSKHETGDIEWYGIEIGVYDDKTDDYIPCFINNEKIYDKNWRWVDLTQISNERFLNQHNIKYNVEREKGIIPIGLVDFSGEILSQTKKELSLKIESNNYIYNFHKYDAMIDNIIEAIMYQYEDFKIKNKFINNDIISITLDD